jgi:stage V sporulation protein G
MPKAQTQKPAPSPAPPIQPPSTHPPLEYDVRIHSIRPEGTYRGAASVSLNGQFAVRGVKIVEGSKGLFVSMPSYRTADGKYKDICFPCATESKAAFDQAVLDAFRQALIQSQTVGQSQEAAPGPFEGPAHAPAMTM